MVKAEADYTQKLVEQCMQELVHDFQDWYGRLHALNYADWQMCSHKKKRKEQTTPFDVNLMRSPVLYLAGSRKIILDAHC